MKTLLLWDIDGTLIHSGRAGMRALVLALGVEFGIRESIDHIDFAGRTDRWIVRQIFAHFQLEASEENFRRLFGRYLELLPTQVDNPGAKLVPGIMGVLDEAGRRGGFVHGLLTGNLRRGAEIKLRHHGLWEHFPFGAFSDDSELRNDLGPHALRRAREHVRAEFEPGRIWVIGDTPHDIACGRAIGARTLAIAAGSFTREQLATHGPDAMIDDYSDAADFFRIIA